MIIFNSIQQKYEALRTIGNIIQYFDAENWKIRSCTLFLRKNLHGLTLQKKDAILD